MCCVKVGIDPANPIWLQFSLVVRSEKDVVRLSQPTTSTRIPVVCRRTVESTTRYLEIFYLCDDHTLQ